MKIDLIDYDDNRFIMSAVLPSRNAQASSVYLEAAYGGIEISEQQRMPPDLVMTPISIQMNYINAKALHKFLGKWISLVERLDSAQG